MLGGIHRRAPMTASYRPRRRPLKTLLARAAARITKRMIPIDSKRIALPNGKIMFVFAGGSGESFALGEEKIRPGGYVRTVNAGDAPTESIRGTIAVLTRGTWGPLGEVVRLTSLQEAETIFGSLDAGTLEIIRRGFKGGARTVLAIRQGTGGVLATRTLVNAAIDRVRLDAKYVGTRGNSLAVTKRVNLLDATLNEVLIYEGTTLLEQITYNPGADNATALAAAVNEKSNLVDAVVLAGGAVDAVSAAAFANGTDPTVNGAAQTAALNLAETEDFNVLVADAHDTTTNALVAGEINEMRASGKRVMGVVAEPTSVAFATRIANSGGFNNHAMAYVLNGFSEGDDDYEGWEAAADAAGAIAGAALTESLTHKVCEDATDIVGPLTNSQIEQAIQAGALVYTKNARGQVQFEYGITTLINPGVGYDEGWKKIRRTRTRDELITQVVGDIDTLLGTVNNDDTGRALLRSRMQGTVNRFIAQGALSAGEVFVDPSNPPQGDSAWFLIAVDDLDSTEKVYLTFALRFAPPVAA